MSWIITPVTVTAAGKSVVGTATTLAPAGFEKVAGGVGGWESLQRPRRDPAAAWVGGTDQTLELPVMLTGIDAGGPNIDRSIESTCSRIVGWGTAAPATGEPPQLRVAGVPGIASTALWVLQGIGWGEYIADRSGARVQQEITLTLLRYRKPALVNGPAKRSRVRKGKTKGKGKK